MLIFKSKFLSDIHSSLQNQYGDGFFFLDFEDSY